MPLPLYDIMSERKYYYSKLTDKEKHICDLVVEAVRSFEKSIRFYFYLNENSFSRVFDVIQKDYPDIFYLDIANTKMIISGLIATVHLAYLYPTSVIRKHQERIDIITDTILSPAIMGRDKLEIETRIHELILRNVDYSPELTNIEGYSIVGPLLNRSGVCQGYSKAFQLLCEKAGIPCLCVYGLSTQPSSSTDRKHVWNMVQLSSSLRCHIDVTWDSCIYHYGSQEYNKYFNVSDESMAFDHSWDLANVPSTIMY